MTTFTELPAALARAKERCQGKAADSDSAYLTELLELSAGTAPDQAIHYRPYLTAARFLEQKATVHTVAVADGATFTGLATPITSLLQLQHSYDLANGLTIPPGFEAVQESQGGGRLRSRSISSQLRP